MCETYHNDICEMCDLYFNDISISEPELHFNILALEMDI